MNLGLHSFKERLFWIKHLSNLKTSKISSFNILTYFISEQRELHKKMNLHGLTKEYESGYLSLINVNFHKKMAPPPAVPLSLFSESQFLSWSRHRSRFGGFVRPRWSVNLVSIFWLYWSTCSGQGSKKHNISTTNNKFWKNCLLVVSKNNLPKIIFHLTETAC